MLYGEISISRTILQIKDDIELKDYNLKSKEIIPFDEMTKIDKLPFKISKEMMVEMAFCEDIKNWTEEKEKTKGTLYAEIDGATWIRNMINEHYPDAVQILDKFHLIENISEYAKIIFKDNKITPKPQENEPQEQP